MQKFCGFFSFRGAILFHAVVLAAIVVAPAARGQTRTAKDIKGLFFVTLARYTEWPEKAFAEANSPIIIGVIGEDPFGKLLESLTKNEIVRGRSLVVRRFASDEEIKECHLLYFGAMNVVRRELVISRLSRRPILTVSDTPGFAREGGAVELFLNDDNKVRLRVSKDALSRASLALSPSIMRLVAFLEWIPEASGWITRNGPTIGRPAESEAG